MSTEESREPSRALAGLAAAMPTAFLLVSCVLFGTAAGALGGVQGAWHMILEAGPWFFGLVFAVAIAWAAASAMLFGAARGAAVPAGILVGFAALPLLVSAVSTVASTSSMLDAVGYADPSSRATIAAQAISESAITGLIGGLLGGALLASVAWGYAFAAHAQRAPGRSVAGAAIGAVASLPLLGLALWGAVGAGFGGATLAIAGFGAVLAAGIAGAAPGRDEPNGRSGPLAASAVLAAALAVTSAALATRSLAFIEVFSALANVGSGSRGELIGMAAAEMMPIVWAARLALPVGLIAVLGVGAWAALRRRPSIGQWAGGAFALLVALVVVGGDVLVNGWVSSTADTLSHEAWHDVDGLEPVELGYDRDDAEVHAIVTPSGVLRADGTSLGPLEPHTLMTFFEGLPEPLMEHARPTLEVAPRAGLVFDRRLTAEQVSVVVTAAAETHVGAFTIVGRGAGAPGETADAVGAAMPLVSMLFARRSSVRVVVGASLPREVADGDEDLFHLELDGAVPELVDVRPGSDATAEERRLDPDGWPTGSERALWLRLTSGDGQTIADALRAADSSGFTPVLTTSIPLERALDEQHDDTPAPEPGVVPVPRDSADQVGRVLSGNADVHGTLSREAIRRVVRRHTNEVRFCYEQGLSRDPNLEGRVTVSFVVSPTGAVETASVATTTLNDAQVESCITQAVGRWTFPAPEGGGSVPIRYPFVLSSAG